MTIARLILHFSHYVGARINTIVSLRERSDSCDGYAMILRKHCDFALYPFVDLSISGSLRDKI